MKKFTLLFLMAALASSISFAQTTIWSEDFASGIPAGWTNSGTDKNSAVHNGMWKYTKTGSHGAYSGGTTLNSPSAANGYIIFDSDSLDSGGPSGAQGTGPALSPQRGYLTTSAFSCSGHSKVYLELYQYLLNFSSNTRVIVSNGTASDTLAINPTLDYSGARTTNPCLKHFDITAVAGNQAAVTLTFLWDAGDYYFWMLDDIKVMDAPANDLKITRAGSYDYTVYPLSQVDTISYYARVTSTGSAPQPDSRARIVVKKAASVVFTDTTPVGLTLPYNVDSPLVGTNTWLPTPVTGKYDCLTYAFSDSTDAYNFDNADTSFFNIQDSIYAIENGAYGGAFFVLNSTGNTEWVNLFTVKHTDTVTSIITSFAHSTTSTPVTTPAGSVVQGKIYSLDPNTLAINNSAALISTQQRTLTASDFGTNFSSYKNVVLKVDPTTGAAGAAILQPGLYAVSILGVSSTGDIVIQSSQKKVSGQLSGQFDASSGNGTPFSFFRNTNMYIRMDFGHGLNMLTSNYTRNPGSATVRPCQPVTYNGTSNSTSGTAVYAWDFGNGDTAIGTSVHYSFPAVGTFSVCLTIIDGGYSTTTCKNVVVAGTCVGINEISEFGNVMMMPNPTTGKVTITAEDVNGAVKIQIYNILGAEVKSYTEEVSGTMTRTYNLSDLSNGNYIVRLMNGDKMTTRRLTIAK